MASCSLRRPAPGTVACCRCFHQCQQVLGLQRADPQQGGQRWVSRTAWRPLWPSASGCSAYWACFRWFPLAARASSRRPPARGDATPGHCRAAQLTASLQRPAGLIRVGKSSSDAVLLRLGTKRICRSRRVVARRQIRPPATSRPTLCPFSFRGTFWRLSQGSEGGQDSPSHLPNRGRSGPICLIWCLIAGAGEGQFFRPCLP